MDHLVCYAVKANSNLAVLHTLAKQGSGADVVSEGEIRRALKAGIPAEKIVFSGVAKTTAEMTYALEQGIYQFNVESEPELDALNDVATAIGKQAPIAIRINPDVDPKTHAKISTGSKEVKFGVEIPKAFELYDKAAQMDGIRIQGVSVHIGSQLLDLTPFEEAFGHVTSFVTMLRERGHTIEVIDAGGGFGIRYDATQQAPELSSYADIVKRTIGELGCRLIFEPGRMMVGNAGILITKVVYVKEGTSKKFAIVDAGMNDLLRPAMYDAYHAIESVIQKTGTTAAYDVVGPVCETGDIFGEARNLPENLTSGDLLVLRSAGAYGAVMSNSYNSRPIIPEVLVDGNQLHIVRKRPEYDIMWKNENIA